MTIIKNRLTIGPNVVRIEREKEMNDRLTIKPRTPRTKGRERERKRGGEGEKGGERKERERKREERVGKTEIYDTDSFQETD